MSWQKFDLLFRVLSPLHIGYLPNKAGTVIARTRYYVPGKNIWGALTARLTGKLLQNPAPADYLNVGSWLKDNFRFSYFYLFDGEKIFLPQYNEKGGLYFGDLSLQKFQQRFISSRISTKISKEGGAEDKTLHEIEFINNQYVADNDELESIYLVGSVFFQKDAKFNNSFQIESKDAVLSLNGFNLFEVLTLGGELNYGFGKVAQTKSIGGLTLVPENSYENSEVEIRLEDESPIIGHLQYNFTDTIE